MARFQEKCQCKLSMYVHEYSRETKVETNFTRAKANSKGQQNSRKVSNGQAVSRNIFVGCKPLHVPEGKWWTGTIEGITCLWASLQIPEFWPPAKSLKTTASFKGDQGLTSYF